MKKKRKTSAGPNASQRGRAAGPYCHTALIPLMSHLLGRTTITMQRPKLHCPERSALHRGVHACVAHQLWQERSTRARADPVAAGPCYYVDMVIGEGPTAPSKAAIRPAVLDGRHRHVRGSLGLARALLIFCVVFFPMWSPAYVLLFGGASYVGHTRPDRLSQARRASLQDHHHPRRCSCTPRLARSFRIASHSLAFVSTVGSQDSHTRSTYGLGSTPITPPCPAGPERDRRKTCRYCARRKCPHEYRNACSLRGKLAACPVARTQGTIIARPGHCTEDANSNTALPLSLSSRMRRAVRSGPGRSGQIISFPGLTHES